MPRKRKNQKAVQRRRGNRGIAAAGSNGGPKTPNAWQNDDGTFKRGNPGNPLAGLQEAQRHAFVDAVPPADCAAIARKLAGGGKRGSVASAKELFDRLWGKPKQEIGLSGGAELRGADAFREALKHDPELLGASRRAAMRGLAGNPGNVGGGADNADNGNGGNGNGVPDSAAH